MKRKFDSIEEELQFVEFRQELLFNNTGIDRLLFEYEITQEEYRQIMNLMDEMRNKLDNHQEIYHGTFEEKMYEIVPSHYGDYHMCEYIAREFMDAGRWEEVFPALYGDMPKYQYLRKSADD